MKYLFIFLNLRVQQRLNFETDSSDLSASAASVLKQNIVFTVKNIYIIYRKRVEKFIYEK